LPLYAHPERPSRGRMNIDRENREVVSREDSLQHDQVTAVRHFDQLLPFTFNRNNESKQASEFIESVFDPNLSSDSPLANFRSPIREALIDLNTYRYVMLETNSTHSRTIRRDVENHLILFDFKIKLFIESLILLKNSGGQGLDPLYMNLLIKLMELTGRLQLPLDNNMITIIQQIWPEIRNYSQSGLLGQQQLEELVAKIQIILDFMPDRNQNGSRQNFTSDYQTPNPIQIAPLAPNGPWPRATEIGQLENTLEVEHIDNSAARISTAINTRADQSCGHELLKDSQRGNRPEIPARRMRNGDRTSIDMSICYQCGHFEGEVSRQCPECLVEYHPACQLNTPNCTNCGHQFFTDNDFDLFDH